MRRRGVVSIFLSIVVAVLGMGSSGVAAEREKIKTSSLKEAWFAQAPPCVSIDCSVVPLVSPYPENTLHVAVSAGQETARTYVVLPLPLPRGSRLLGGTLKLPVDTDPTHGGVTPEAAHMIACITKTDFKKVRGSFDEPPKTDCEERTSAHYDEKSVAYTIDLDLLAKRWKKDKVGLALLPSKAAVDAGETWRVVFPATPKQETEESARAIVATLNYTILGGEVPVGSDPFDEPVSSEPRHPSTDLGSGSAVSGFDSASGVGAGTTTTDLAQADVPTEVPTTPVVQPVANFIQGFAGPGFAYPMVWALPLVFLAGLAAVGHALTKPLYRRGN